MWCLVKASRESSSAKTLALWGGRNARALKCAHELGEERVTRVKPITAKNKVKQKKGKQ